MPADPLRRLTAGLAEEERIARAAGAPNQQWVLADGDVWRVHDGLDSPARCDQHEPGRPNECDDSPIGLESDFDPQGHIAAYIARQQPKVTLDRVEAIRKVIAIHADNGDGRCIVCVHIDEDSAFEFPCPTLRALASIYPEDTDETEES